MWGVRVSCVTVCKAREGLELARCCCLRSEGDPGVRPIAVRYSEADLVVTDSCRWDGGNPSSARILLLYVKYSSARACFYFGFDSMCVLAWISMIYATRAV